MAKITISKPEKKPKVSNHVLDIYKTSSFKSSTLQKRSSLVVGVNLLRADVAVLARAEGVGRSNSLTVDVADTEPSELASLVDNSEDSVSGSRVLNVPPRNGEVAAGLVGEGLGGGVATGHADDGAVLGLAVGDDVEVVVAAGVAVTAVAVYVVEGPGLAVDLLGV